MGVNVFYHIIDQNFWICDEIISCAVINSQTADDIGNRVMQYLYKSNTRLIQQ